MNIMHRAGTASKAKRANPEDVAIGAAIRSRRLAAGLSQTALGDSVGVTFQQVQKYEKGVNRVAGSRLIAIARALGTTVAELIGAVEGGDPAPTSARSPMLVIFDLDGTLALTEHRAHFLGRPSKDWRGFYAACDGDSPCHPLIRAALAFATAGEDVQIWSGRSDEVAEKTAAWLAAHGLGHIALRTRRAGDHRPDTELKREWMEELGRKPDLVFEDRARVVEMWRSHGIVCCQVAPGEF